MFRSTSPKPLGQALLAALLACALGSVAQAETARGVYLGSNAPGKWKNGSISWKYNSAGKPANITDQQALDAINKGFAAWAAVCQINAQYAGTTSTAVGNTSANEVVVGFADIGQYASADAGPYSSDSASRFTFYTGGSIRLNTNGNVSLSDSLADGRVLTHEVGHLLGFDHSDDPFSIMYANPYNNFSSLTGDDIETCANLYGGKGMQTLTDLSRLPADGGLGLSAEITASTPAATGSATTLSAVTAGSPAFFTLRWRGIQPTDTITYRFIAPNGLAYVSTSGAATYSQAYNYLPLANLGLGYNGQWQFQGLVNGKLATTLPFTLSGASSGAVAKMEYAAIVEQGAAGSLTPRTVNYSAVATSYVNAYANDSYGTAVTTVSPIAGANRVDFWAKSVLPRYGLDLANGRGGQSTNSADAVKQVSFSASNGTLSGNGITVAETGSQQAYSARANIESSASGSQGVYVAAMLGGQLFYRHSTGWDSNATPLFSFSAPGAANFDVLRGFDSRIIPAGTLLFVGYGSSLSDVLAKSQYKLVRTF
ncbi:matrixin family metalloprotease [Chitinimonas sp.]|uniref:matrixin family metalloprotease n=1 Tax=Chitinimonas sp. TaxID=1934313 RepID=UPI0035B2E778